MSGGDDEPYQIQTTRESLPNVRHAKHGFAGLMGNSSSAGRRVLVVEDESLVSMVAEDILLDAGYEVVLAARTSEAAQLAFNEKFDVAVLDVNLGGGETSYSVAALLVERGVPVAFASGYSGEAMPTEFRSFVMSQKPYHSAALLKGVSEALSRQL